MMMYFFLIVNGVMFIELMEMEFKESLDEFIDMLCFLVIVVWNGEM